MRVLLAFALLAAIGWRAKELAEMPVQQTAVKDTVRVDYGRVEPSFVEPYANVLGCDLVAFSDSVNVIADRLGVPAVWLHRTMCAESGLNPKAKNVLGAVGLIQFMPATARDLGISGKELLQMTAIEQLAFVEKFYKKSPARRYAEFRLYAFFPAAIRWDMDRVLKAPGLSASEVARRNPAHDLNGDGQITKREYLKSVGYVFTH